MLHSSASQTRILSFSSFFIGGVFLGVGLLHMLPDASRALSSYYSFPIVYLTAAVGFLLIYALDRINFSDHQLDNSALLSMAVRGERSTICYVSVRPVVLSYGSLRSGFRNNSAIKQQAEAVTSMRRLSGDGGGTSVLEGSGTAGDDLHKGWLDAVEGDGGLVKTVQQAEDGGGPAHVDDDARVAVYHSLMVVPVNENGEEAKETAAPIRTSPPPSRSRPQPPSACCADRNCHQSAAVKEEPTAPLLSASSDTSAAAAEEDDEEGEHEHEALHHHLISIPAHALLPIFLALVFSVHSAIEGLALGAQTALGGSALSLLIAIASHKLIEAISVGANFVKQKVAMTTALPVLGIYTLMTPGGILAGWGLGAWMGGGGGEEGEGEGTGEVSWAVLFQSLLQAFAAGSFLYLAVHEVSDEKCCAVVKRWQQVVLMLSGVAIMSLLALYA